MCVSCMQVCICTDDVCMYCIFACDYGMFTVCACVPQRVFERRCVLACLFTDTVGMHVCIVYLCLYYSV